uniref:Uncharacterized protein n=1 Tax=Glossina brevipalpis TaxID=37001 RepID=A0A1A9WC47_9MUSC
MSHIKKLIIILAGLSCLMNEILSACVCNKEGSDYCLNCSEGKVITPKHPLTNEPSEVNLSPIGDKCWCSKQTVEPVALGETCPKHKTTTCNCESSDSGHFVDSSIYSKTFSTNIQDNSPSADPISVNLARKAGQAIAVPEAKLSYGFIQKPIEALPRTYYSTIQEENLFAHKNDVITLHKSLPIAVERESNDYLDMDDEEDDVTIDGTKNLRLTYKDLGYVTERFPNPKFRKVISSSPSSSSAHDSSYYQSKGNKKDNIYELDTYQK